MGFSSEDSAGFGGPSGTPGSGNDTDNNDGTPDGGGSGGNKGDNPNSINIVKGYPTAQPVDDRNTPTGNTRAGVRQSQLEARRGKVGPGTKEEIGASTRAIERAGLTGMALQAVRAQQAIAGTTWGESIMGAVVPGFSAVTFGARMSMDDPGKAPTAIDTTPEHGVGGSSDTSNPIAMPKAFTSTPTSSNNNVTIAADFTNPDNLTGQDLRRAKRTFARPK